MPALCDANLLLAAVYEQHAHHALASAWLDKQTNGSAVLCRVAQLALLRLLTNSTVMGTSVCTPDVAWQIWDTTLYDTRFVFMAEPDNLEPILRLYTHANVPSPKLWQDAYLAAFSRSVGLTMATFDRGFRRFPDLQLELLT